MLAVFIQLNYSNYLENLLLENYRNTKLPEDNKEIYDLDDTKLFDEFSNSIKEGSRNKKGLIANSCDCERVECIIVDFNKADYNQIACFIELKFEVNNKETHEIKMLKLTENKFDDNIESKDKQNFILLSGIHKIQTYQKVLTLVTLNFIINEFLYTALRNYSTLMNTSFCYPLLKNINFQYTIYLIFLIIGIALATFLLKFVVMIRMNFDFISILLALFELMSSIIFNYNCISLITQIRQMLVVDRTDSKILNLEFNIQIEEILLSPSNALRLYFFTKLLEVFICLIYVIINKFNQSNLSSISKPDNFIEILQKRYIKLLVLSLISVIYIIGKNEYKEGQFIIINLFLISLFFYYSLIINNNGSLDLFYGLKMEKNKRIDYPDLSF